MEFNIGNRVKCNAERYGYGEIEGTVVEIKMPCTYPYTVLLDNGKDKPFAEEEIESVLDDGSNRIWTIGQEPVQYATVYGILSEAADLYAKKNHDYGDSFSALFKDFGLAYSVPRIYEKATRLKTLLKAENEVNESVRDTLMDICLYCAMTIVELDKKGK